MEFVEVHTILQNGKILYPLPGEEPTEEEAQEAIWMAEQIRTFVRRRLPF